MGHLVFLAYVGFSANYPPAPPATLAQQPRKIEHLLPIEYKNSRDCKKVITFELFSGFYRDFQKR